MEIQGEKILSVPRSDVWRALNDPAVLQRCIPGCDSFEADGENKYRVAMQMTVGPVRARFSGKLALSDAVPLTSYAMSFEGSGGVAGFGKGTAHVSLDDVDGGTRLRYNAQAQVGGRLAQVGARLIDGVTKRMSDDFFTRFANELSGAKPAGALAATAPGQAAAMGSVPRSVTTTAVATPHAVQHQQPAPQSNHIAVLAAAISATAAAVAVLAALYVLQFTG
ncbi:carbon monoxide dehydrogenase subunit G [Hydrogenophaga sp. 2FB]|uniref:CoxG family protein n=1 Tax=Hydrogenophaga sp. 2FB TaxID=2502187 RepID=UPI0010F67DEE|nr:carbon monoxide dehydrogenase subunit G [Hydrogenophaga sp. 2FB]